MWINGRKRQGLADRKRGGSEPAAFRHLTVSPAVHRYSDSCFMEGVSYRSPDEENPAFLELVDVSSTEACHEACLWMEGCAFFTMLMLTEASISGYLCNLWTADAVAFVTAEYGPISGPKVCPVRVLITLAG
ncbi:hypothetical protein CYMTET_46922 [Cymbomonas tetramitiformis]|uniref:Apple domain-containing protein n=1 Tax=Cymbomonas tetramitiformis TaxID=36881 RepID=A0AAE0BWK5_9CHLO|nr:hypothetical protein CYMTET_46922 [Cymbomonas tetramitiformis]